MFGASVIKCRGDPGVWGTDGMWVDRPEGEDWSGTPTPEVKAAQEFRQSISTNRLASSEAKSPLDKGF